MTVLINYSIFSVQFSFPSSHNHFSLLIYFIFLIVFILINLKYFTVKLPDNSEIKTNKNKTDKVKFVLKNKTKQNVSSKNTNQQRQHNIV